MCKWATLIYKTWSNTKLAETLKNTKINVKVILSLHKQRIQYTILLKADGNWD